MNAQLTMNVMNDAVFMLLGAVLFAIVTAALNYYQDKKEALAHKLVPLNLSKLCKNHSWLAINAYINVDYKVEHMMLCRVCGLVKDQDIMAHPNMIDRLEDESRKAAAEYKIKAEFMAKEDEQIESLFQSEISEGLNAEKLVFLHEAGMSFEERFESFKKTKALEMYEEINKGNA